MFLSESKDLNLSLFDLGEKGVVGELAPAHPVNYKQE